MVDVDQRIIDFHEELMSKPMKVLRVFEDFFGKDRVELQNFGKPEAISYTIGKTSVRDFIKDRLSNFTIADLESFKELSSEQKNTLHNICDDPGDNTYLDAYPELTGLFLEVLRANLVDLYYSSGFILIYFPYVRVTNEYDRYIDIKDLWVKVGVNSDGTGRGYFTMNRSIYTYLQFTNDYMHSHVAKIPKTNFSSFQTPCLGEGPIAATCNSLLLAFDESLWNLFCLELDKYVGVESIAGTPYHNLESVLKKDYGRIDFEGSFSNSIWHDPFTYKEKDILLPFIEKLARNNKIKFSYINGKYCLGTSILEYIILISNEFIDWINKDYSKFNPELSLPYLEDASILRRVIISEGKIFSPVGQLNSAPVIEGDPKVCTFKGKPIICTLEEDSYNEAELSLILDPKICGIILNSMLKILNCKYGKDKRESQSGIYTGEKYL